MLRGWSLPSPGSLCRRHGKNLGVGRAKVQAPSCHSGSFGWGFQLQTWPTRWVPLGRGDPLRGRRCSASPGRSGQLTYMGSSGWSEGSRPLLPLPDSATVLPRPHLHGLPHGTGDKRDIWYTSGVFDTPLFIASLAAPPHYKRSLIVVSAGLAL